MVSLAPKRGLERLEEADYRRAVRPRLDADLGEPVDVRELVSPNDPSKPSSFTPKLVPTTSASNKKSNAQIPYVRVTRDADALGVVGSPVFVRADVADPLVVSMPNERLDAVAGIEAVNAELATVADDAATTAWRVSGVLLSTESEIDGVLQDFGVRNTATTTSLLEAVQGPTQLRNIYSARPLIGDICYLGLIWLGDGKGFGWTPFSSQHLDMEFVPTRPRAPRMGFAGHAKHKPLEVPGLTSSERQRISRVICLGRVLDTAPSPGMITLHVDVREMTWAELGRRHDESNVRIDPITGEWTYEGAIGSRSPSRVSPPTAPPTATATTPPTTLGDLVAAYGERTLDIPSDDNDDTRAVLKLARALVRLDEAVRATSAARAAGVASARLRAVAAAAADGALARPVAAYARALVPILQTLASDVVTPLGSATGALLQRAALDLEVFFTLAETAAGPPTPTPTPTARVLALARTASGRDDDARVWTLQRAAVALGAIDALLVAR